MVWHRCAAQTSVRPCSQSREYRKGYAAHEQQTLENITNARATAMSVPTGQTAQKATAENALSGALRLFALSENYPDLKANANFLELQQQLTETEDQIASSRRIYNGNVTAYNVKVQSIPSNIVASIHHFSEREFLRFPKKNVKNARNSQRVVLSLYSTVRYVSCRVLQESYFSLRKRDIDIEEQCPK